MNELRQWKQKQATGALSDRQERRMQFLQAQQDRQRMANQAEQVMQNHFNPQPQQQGIRPMNPAQDPNWVKGAPGLATDLAQNWPNGLQGGNQVGAAIGERTQPGIVKINDPETWASHAPNQGILGQYQGQNIDPGFNRPWTQNIDPGSVYQPGSNPQVDAAFDMMRKRRPGVPYMNLK